MHNYKKHLPYVEIDQLNGLKFVLESDLLFYSPSNPNYIRNACTPLPVLDVNRTSAYLSNLEITGAYVDGEETVLEAMVDFDLENPLFIEIDTRDYRRLVEELAPDAIIDLDSDDPAPKRSCGRRIPGYEISQHPNGNCRVKPKSNSYMKRNVCPVWKYEIPLRRKYLYPKKGKNQQ